MTAMNPDITSENWALKCAERLQEQWPRVDRSDLEHLAWALISEPYWQGMDPSDAALEWLQQGVSVQRDARPEASNDPLLPCSR
ncbi:hypothetical protein SAMN02787076_04846 [Rhizobacter sp. OV335]|jgi:hypothetical protein|nr:hypothetical protein SAMN02787076_04846 [Rhizobacter sp. OV335]